MIMSLEERKIRRDEMNAEIVRRYPEEGPDQLAEDLGLSRAAVILRANRNGITRDEEAKYEQSSRTRTERHDTVDLSIFDPLSHAGAYYLGLCWSDGTVAYKEHKDFVKGGQWPGFYVNYTLTDWEPLYDLAKRLGFSSERVRNHKKYKEHHKQAKTLKISGRRIAGMFIRQYGIPMRKSYIDPPFPSIPNEFLGSFARGVFDGDGSNTLGSGTLSMVDGVPYRYFYGSEKFLRELEERISSQTTLRFRRIYPHSQSKSLYGVAYTHQLEVNTLTRFLHPELELGQTDYPYIKRKHEVCLKLLIQQSVIRREMSATQEPKQSLI